LSFATNKWHVVGLLVACVRKFCSVVEDNSNDSCSERLRESFELSLTAKVV
jgi:hypothetical protein